LVDIADRTDILPSPQGAQPSRLYAVGVLILIYMYVGPARLVIANAPRDGCAEKKLHAKEIIEIKVRHLRAERSRILPHERNGSLMRFFGRFGKRTRDL